VKTSKIAITATSAALFAATGLFGAPLAGAETADLGEQAELNEGNVVQGWTISDLKQSSDPVSYPVRGTLWEATATNEAIQGNVQPIVSNLNARSESGETYRVLFQIASPQGISPAGLAQGQKATGKVYFDVTGPAPDTVVYNDGTQDLLTWVQPAAEPAATGTGAGSASAPAAPASPAEAPAATDDAPEAVTEDAPEAVTDEVPEAVTEDAPEAVTDPAATGRQGTPLPEDAAVAEATPAAPEATPATPAPEGAPHGPAAEPAAGSQGTPLPAQEPAATADAVEGTPHGPAATPTTPVTPAPTA